MYVCVISAYQISSFSLVTAVKQRAEDSFALLLSFWFIFYKNVLQTKVNTFSRGLLPSGSDRYFFFSWRYNPQWGLYFYSPLVGFSLLTYDVS